MSISREFEAKRSRIADYLGAHGLDGVFLGRQDRFAWAGCGAANYINTATESGTAVLYVPAEGKASIITTNIEATRFRAEEPIAKIAEVREHPWHDSAGREGIAKDLAAGRKCAGDAGFGFTEALEADFDELRFSLLPEELERYRALGRDCGAAIEKVGMNVEPGVTELDVAGDLARESYALDVLPIVVLVAADDRLRAHRHPLPTTNAVRNIVMIVLCGRRGGLIACATRIVHFGALSKDLAKRHVACAAVDAAAISATRPGAGVGEVFRQMQAAYAAGGHPDEWELHHQGGPCGYATRDYLATAGDERKVVANQPFAWNPSITGTKTEDTIVATPGGPEIVTASANWPTIDFDVEGTKVPRPAILVR